MSRFAVMLWVLCVVVACSTEHLGQPCGTVADAVANPVDGETAVVETVRIERDSVCESFQCLTHRGLPPFCTRTCTLDSAPKPKSCSADTDCASAPFAGADHPGQCINNACACTLDNQCKEPTHCQDGACVNDDCPNGFWCEHVQDVGPLANNRYCVFKTGCQTNLQCEDLGNMQCNQLGCLDACARDFYTCDKPNKSDCDDLGCYNDCIRLGSSTYLCLTLNDGCKSAGCFDSCTPPPGSTCDDHRLVCEPFSDFACGCANGSTLDVSECPPSQLECRPQESVDDLPVGAVRKLSVCQPK